MAPYSVMASGCVHTWLTEVGSNSESASSQDDLNYKVVFFACSQGSIEVTNVFNNFKWVWSGMPKVIQNNELVIPQKYA